MLCFICSLFAYMLTIKSANDKIKSTNTAKAKHIFKNNANDASILQRLLKILHDINAFYVDISKLKEILIYKNASYLKLNFEDFIDESKSNDDHNMSFGLFYANYKSLFIEVSFL